MTELAGNSNGSLVSRHNRLGDRQPHSGTAHEITLIFPTIELVENHALFEIVDARAAVSHTRRHIIACAFCGDNDGLFL